MKRGELLTALATYGNEENTATFLELLGDVCHDIAEMKRTEKERKAWRVMARLIVSIQLLLEGTTRP